MNNDKDQIQELERRQLENEMKDQIEEILKRLYYLEKINEVFTTAPAYTPKTFKEHFAFYDTGGVRRLYIFISGSWYYAALT